MQRTCTCCGEEKPLDAYRFNLRTGRYAFRCLECGDNVRDKNKYFYTSIRNYLVKALNKAKCNKKRGLHFDLTIDDLLEVYEQQGGKCAVTGVEMTYTMEKPQSRVSIDRIDCNVGYEKANVRLVCSAVNLMRNRMEDEELLFWSTAVVKGMTRGN